MCFDCISYNGCLMLSQCCSSDFCDFRLGLSLSMAQGLRHISEQLNSSTTAPDNLDICCSGCRPRLAVPRNEWMFIHS